MVRLLYNLLWPLGLLVFLPASLRKMFRRGGYRKDFGQRLGIYSGAARRTPRGATWIHAVSVGEIMIALKIAEALRALEPGLHCVLTTTTTTGHAFATRVAPEWIEVFYSPLDFWPVMRRAFQFIAPQRIILIEAEVWPNLVARAKAKRAPIILANARLSPRSAARFQRFRPFVAPIFRQLDLVCVSDESDAGRWGALGATNIRVVGNVKYDLSAEGIQPRESLPADDAPVLLGASTHAGEEEILARIFRELRPEFPTLQLVLAPRHVERAPAIERMLRATGLAVRRPSDGDEADCLLLDTTGELRTWLRTATIVFVGKSLTARGGQNPIEAVAAGKPVIFGPNMQNFARLSQQLVAAGGAIVVQNTDDLREPIRQLLRDSPMRDDLVRRARGVISEHQGAAMRTAAEIERLGRGP